MCYENASHCHLHDNTTCTSGNQYGFLRWYETFFVFELRFGTRFLVSSADWPIHQPLFILPHLRFFWASTINWSRPVIHKDGRRCFVIEYLFSSSYRFILTCATSWESVSMKILGMEMIDLSTSLPGIRNSQKGGVAWLLRHALLKTCTLFARRQMDGLMHVRILVWTLPTITNFCQRQYLMPWNSNRSPCRINWDRYRRAIHA